MTHLTQSVFIASGGLSGRTYMAKKAPVVNKANCLSLNSVKSNHFSLESHFLRGRREVIRIHEKAINIPIISAVYRIAP